LMDILHFMQECLDVQVNAGRMVAVGAWDTPICGLPPIRPRRAPRGPHSMELPRSDIWLSLYSPCLATEWCPLLHEIYLM
jgi:hypothetical protein